MFDTGTPAPTPHPSPARDLLEANRRLEARVAELLAIQDITQAIAAELDIHRMLATCLSAVARAIEAASAAVLLAAGDERTLVVWARHGRDRRYLLGERRAAGEGIAGWVAQHRVPLLVRALDEQPAFREAARADGYQAGTFLAVPLERQGRLLGVLGATETLDGRAFGERDLRVLIALAEPIAIAIENARRHEAVQDGALGVLGELAGSQGAVHEHFRGHAQRVADYATRAGRELGLGTEELRTLRRAALVHDVGMALLGEAVVSRPGPLAPPQRRRVRRHPLESERLARSLGFLDGACPIVRAHHERWDGRGYPDGLEGRQTDPLARLLGIADAYDAMTSPRPYRPALRRDEALGELARGAGTQFDPSFVKLFARALGEPSGESVPT